MITQNPTLNPSRNLQDHPSYFGVYLNMARHNVFLVENHLAQKFNAAKGVEDDEHLAASFLKEYNKNNPNHLYSHLIHFVPVFSVYDQEFMMSRKEKKELLQNDSKALEKGKDFKKLAVDIGHIFKDLNILRNNYTHFANIEDDWKRKPVVSNETKYFISIAFKKAVKYCQYRFRSVEEIQQSTNSFKALSKLKLFLDVDSNELSLDGLVFFTSIFLNRTQLFQFINKVQTYKSATQLEFRLKREIIAAFALRLPFEKIKSDNPGQALSLDILNELRKIPSEIYRNISQEEQKKYIPQLTPEGETNVVVNSIREDEEDIDTYLSSIISQYRKSNRFYYQALKLIDLNNLLPNIGIQLKLGKYLLKSYKKKIGNHDELDRHIVEKLYAFGSLSDYDNEEEVIQTLGIDADKIENYSPSYVLQNNKFQLKLYNAIQPKFDVNFNKENTDYLKYQDTSGTRIFSVSKYALPQILLLEKFDPGSTLKILRRFLGNTVIDNFAQNDIEKIKNDLNFRPYYRLVLNSKAPLQKVGDYKLEMEKRIASLNSKLAVYNIKASYLPQQVINYMINTSPSSNQHKLKEYIQQMKATDRQLMSDFGKDIRPRIGEMATHIANDIKNMIISLDVKQKLTGFYYDKIQECLALYADEDKRKLFSSIIYDLSLESAGGHPFLGSINYKSITSTSAFFKQYYIAKVGDKGNGRSWLEKTFYFKETGKSGKPITVIKLPNQGYPYSLHKYKTNPSDSHQTFAWKAKNYVDVPTSIFNDKLKDVLIEKLKSNSISVDANDNYSTLLKKWYNGEMQSFYNYPREYDIFEEKIKFDLSTTTSLKDIIEHKASIITEQKRQDAKEIKGKRFNIQFTRQRIKQLLHKRVSHNEKEIRIIQEQDMIMSFYLPNELQINSLHNLDDALNKEMDIKASIHGITIIEKRKAKDFGALKRIIKDKRLKGIAHYLLNIGNNEIELDIIKDILRKYNDIRNELFDKVFELEKMIFEHQASKSAVIYACKAEGKSNNIQFHIYLKWLSVNGYLNITDEIFLSDVRNKLSHNETPIIESINGDDFLDQIRNRFVEIIDKTLDNLT